MMKSLYRYWPLLIPLLLIGCSPLRIDSQLSREQAIYSHQPPDVSADIQQQLVVVPVRYYGFDGNLHQGQVVIHHALANDIRNIFETIRISRFPIASALPIAHPRIQKKGPYGLSPDTNNSSGYVWRPIVAGARLSMHALGLAIDINPRQNPYIKGSLIIPPGAAYVPAAPGTLTAESEVVQAFKKAGWEWGGDWTQGSLDYMHFQKLPAKFKNWAARYRPPVPLQ